jgi:hypothetical protein
MVSGVGDWWNMVEHRRRLGRPKATNSPYAEKTFLEKVFKNY